MLEQALEAHRSVGGEIAAREVEKLKVRLQNVRAAAVEALPMVDLGRFNIADCVEHARNCVRGRTSMRALIGLCTVALPMSEQTLRERAKEANSRSLFAAIASSQRLSHSGRVIERSPDADDEEGRLLQQMHADVTSHHKLVAIGGILPALRQLQLDHGLRESDMFYLAERSSFVPHGREKHFAKGLAAGLFEDFDLAAHKLVPQFENALRWHLARIGVPTLSFSPSGTQNELDLNKVLEHPRLHEVFDSTTIFDWRSLLTEKAGMNMRNELAHGLLDRDDADQEFMYFWWCVLRAVLLPIIVGMAPEAQP